MNGRVAAWFKMIAAVFFLNLALALAVSALLSQGLR